MAIPFAGRELPWIGGFVRFNPVGWRLDGHGMDAPDGRIHFSGDFKTFKTGWAEGAIELGLRAARQIDPTVIAEGRSSVRQEPDWRLLTRTRG